MLVAAILLLVLSLVPGCDDPAEEPSGRCEEPCPIGQVRAPGSCSCVVAAGEATAPDAASGVSLLDAAACLPVPCPKGSPWNPATCRCERRCTLEAHAAELARVGALDCGTLTVASDRDARFAAQACVLEASAAQRAFTLIHWQQGIDSIEGMAYASAGGETLASILDYDGSFGLLSGNGTIWEQTCQRLSLDPTCELTEQTLCLKCAELVESSISCTAQPISDSAACRGPGNYESGKERSYLPCCAGLREVFHQRASQDGDRRACIDLPLRIYACVEGRCGDGRCEEAEAVPCGCGLDCPSAVWAAPERTGTSP